MVGLSTLVALGGRPEICMLFTIRKYVFLTFLDDHAIVFPPTITLISPSGALSLSSLVGWARGPLASFHHP